MCSIAHVLAASGAPLRRPTILSSGQEWPSKKTLVSQVQPHNDKSVSTGHRSVSKPRASSVSRWAPREVECRQDGGTVVRGRRQHRPLGHHHRSVMMAAQRLQLAAAAAAAVSGGASLGEKRSTQLAWRQSCPRAALRAHETECDILGKIL